MYTNYNYTKMLFFSIMMMSTLFSISSISFINMWMGMEINLISFIPLMINNNNSLSSESMMKYFLIQSLSSVNFLLSSVIIIHLNKWFNYTNSLNVFIFFIMNISLLMKMGAAPFHFWFPKTMKGLSWVNCLILSTWQKIIPMMILSYCFMLPILYIFIVSSVILGSIMGFNQTSLQMILTYSSINHIGWMLTNMMINMNMWMLYFLIYSFLNIILMYMFNSMKIFHLTQIYSSKSSIYLNLFIFINLLSLGGLPPFLGFLPKWLTINFMISNNFYLLNLILIMSSLINLFFYLRIMYSFLMMNYFETKFNKIIMLKLNFIMMMTFMSIFGLILFTMIMLM